MKVTIIQIEGRLEATVPVAIVYDENGPMTWAGHPLGWTENTAKGLKTLLAEFPDAETKLVNQSLFD